MIEIDIGNIKFGSINEKYGFNPRIGRLFINPDYQKFGETLKYEFLRVRRMVEAPYKIKMNLHTYCDIDNCIKAILDSMQGIIIKDDKDVLDLHVKKVPIRKGEPGRLYISVESLK